MDRTLASSPGVTGKPGRAGGYVRLIPLVTDEGLADDG